jgi:NAD(P)-dependent dehydrogenase (short-subunit alcohol dehydrogenase family)
MRRSRLVAGWTARDIPDLTGKTAVVTGANSGLGLYTALELSRRGAHVVLACRNLDKGGEAVEWVRGRVPDASLELTRLDLSELASVREFASAYAARHDGLDVLVNNAGVMAIPYRLTTDGFEMQFGTNHLGPFALTALLMPSLQARPAARVVTVSSIMHLIGSINFDNLQHERSYSKWFAYGQSKLANLLFALELDRRCKRAGAGVLSVAAHPGYAHTNLQATGPEMAGRHWQARAMELLNVIVAQPGAKGALSSLYGGTAPDVRGGEFFGPSLILRGRPKRSRPSPAARNTEVAQRLWGVSAELTGVSFATIDAMQ